MLQKERNNIESANIFYRLSEYQIIKHIIVLGRNNQTIKRHFTNEISVSVTVSFLIAYYIALRLVKKHTSDS